MELLLMDFPFGLGSVIIIYIGQIALRLLWKMTPLLLVLTSYGRDKQAWNLQSHYHYHYHYQYHYHQYYHHHQHYTYFYCTLCFHRDLSSNAIKSLSDSAFANIGSIIVL